MPLASPETSARYTAKQKSREPTRDTVTAYAKRWCFEGNDLADNRIRAALSFKAKLDREASSLKGGQYTAKRIAEVARRFGFLTSDLSHRNIVLLIRGVIDGELFIDSLRRAINE